jgi:hypothetical protein
VLRVVESAERHLRTLADDPAAAFGVGEADGPRAVHDRVRAIWWALLSDHAVAYVGPPGPAAASQRLRTPRETLRAGRGTCIDLSLLLAAALEHAGVDPVLFLTRGHALVGYWSSGAGRDDFFAMRDVAGADGPDDVSEARHVAPASAHGEVWRALEAGRLVPLEASALAGRSAFAAAVEAGREELRDGASFEAMLDVRAAREEGCTPLPVLEGAR